MNLNLLHSPNQLPQLKAEGKSIGQFSEISPSRSSQARDDYYWGNSHQGRRRETQPGIPEDVAKLKRTSLVLEANAHSAVVPEPNPACPTPTQQPVQNEQSLPLFTPNPQLSLLPQSERGLSFFTPSPKERALSPQYSRAFSATSPLFSAISIHPALKEQELDVHSAHHLCHDKIQGGEASPRVVRWLADLARSQQRQICDHSEHLDQSLGGIQDGLMEERDLGKNRRGQPSPPRYIQPYQSDTTAPSSCSIFPEPQIRQIMLSNLREMAPDSRITFLEQELGEERERRTEQIAELWNAIHLIQEAEIRDPTRSSLLRPEPISEDENNSDDDNDESIHRSVSLRSIAGKDNRDNDMEEFFLPHLPRLEEQILKLNPRLAPTLLRRLAAQQFDRYTRLVNIKRKHGHDTAQGKCKAGSLCFTQGGQAEALQSYRAHVQFQIPGREKIDGGPEISKKANTTIAKFPAGIPHPPMPVSIFPAHFECPFCFHGKKFQKPADWTNHIYEDIEPFICTFEDCSYNKPFKRKADWFRHENERHRQLTWWECSFTGCKHRSYRKDGFIQHLVREHQIPDPILRSKSNPTTREQEATKTLEFVENCRRDTTKRPQDEPCRFCGTVYTNWTKLTNHMADHMKQIALSILNHPERQGTSIASTSSSSRSKRRRLEPVACLPIAQPYS